MEGTILCTTPNHVCCGSQRQLDCSRLSISTLAIGPSAWASGGAPKPQNGNHYRTCDDFRVLQNYLRARGDPPSDYVNNRVSACAD